MNTPQTGAPLEIVAAITAVLSVALDQPVGSFAIKSITPVAAQPQVSMWAKAGLVEGLMARRQFGMRIR